MTYELSEKQVLKTQKCYSKTASINSILMFDFTSNFQQFIFKFNSLSLSQSLLHLDNVHEVHLNAEIFRLPVQAVVLKVELKNWQTS